VVRKAILTILMLSSNWKVDSEGNKEIVLNV